MIGSCTLRKNNNDDIIKREGDRILSDVRKRIKNITTNEDDRFLLNRWVYARLQADERRTKDGLRKELFQENNSCYFCEKPLKPEQERIHLHRLKENRRYIKGNCVLAHQKCHQEAQKKEKR